MTLFLSIMIAILFGAGAFLMLKRDLIRVVGGAILISNAVNLFIMSAGLLRGRAPIYPLAADEPVADPLVQAMVLTSIVIGFGIAALLLSLVYRVYTARDPQPTDEDGLPTTSTERALARDWEER